MKITAVNNASSRNNYNNVNFTGKKQQKPQHEPRHSSSTLKAIPLATLIAMSPLNAPSATYEMDQNPEKVILMENFKNETDNVSIRFIDTDGDENTAEEINLESIKSIERQIPDRTTKQKVPVKYATVFTLGIDSLKQVNVTTKYQSDGKETKSTEYYIVGPSTKYTSAAKTTDGSNKIIRPAKEEKDEHHTYEITKQIYDYLKQITSDGIPKKIEQRRDYISTEEEYENLYM